MNAPDRIAAPVLPADSFRPDMRTLDFSEAPYLVIWETTRSCDLACKHCRAEAVTTRHPLELTTAEAKRMMDDVRRFGRPLFVLTGGDPLKRPDVVELVEYGTSIGLRMAMTPSGTPLMTEAVLRDLRAAGLSRLAISLDGSHPGIHDEFRQVAGSFEHGLRILRRHAPSDLVGESQPLGQQRRRGLHRDGPAP